MKTALKIVIPIILLFFINCRREKFLDDSSARISFSSDTVLFDTVFTTFATANKILMVYNPNNKPVKLSSVRLAGGNTSFYQINFNGASGTSFNDVEIYPNDSIYVFVAVKVEQVGQDKPLLVKDSILFSLNGNQQKVLLVSYGQDVNVLKNNHLSTQNWSSNKPYLLFGNITVDSSQTLTMSAGTRVYMYNNASITVHGSLQIKGTPEQRVLIQQSRLESFYYDIEGQWGKIILTDASNNNLIENTDIFSPVIGIQIGEPEFNSFPDLTIKNTMIINAKLSCLKAFGANIIAQNCVFANASEGCVILYKGGKYNFTHCTINNGGTNTSLGQAQLNSFYYNDKYTNDKGIFSGSLDSIEVINSVIYGGGTDAMDMFTSSEYYYFKNCVMYADWSKFNISDPLHFDSIFYEQQNIKLFQQASIEDPEEEKYNFTPDSLSYLRGKASLKYSLSVPLDMVNYNRIDSGKPDIGAIQWQPKKD